MGRHDFISVLSEHLREPLSLSHGAAFEIADRTVRHFLHDSRVGFGHPSYAWDEAAAKQLADEYVFAHCEPLPHPNKADDA